jgi:hypothetical protein
MDLSMDLPLGRAFEKGSGLLRIATTAPKLSGSVPSSGAFNTGKAPPRMLNVLSFEFDAHVAPT